MYCPEMPARARTHPFLVSGQRRCAGWRLHGLHMEVLQQFKADVAQFVRDTESGK